jgi:hypothetical protein
VSATVILGRDGMGAFASEDDFLAWVNYVCEHIDAAAGLDVLVETRDHRDVQTDAIWSDEESEIRDALITLWEEFCSSPELWPSSADERVQVAS